MLVSLSWAVLFLHLAELACASCELFAQLSRARPPSTHGQGEPGSADTGHFRCSRGSFHGMKARLVLQLFCFHCNCPFIAN